MWNRTRANWFDYTNLVIMLLLCFCMIYPFIYTLSLSLSSPSEAMKQGWFFYPHDFQPYAYLGLLHDHLFWNSYKNIVLVTAIGTLLGLLVSSCAAYTLSKAWFPFRVPIIYILLFSMLFNGGLIPSFLLIKNLHLLDTWFPLWTSAATGAFNIILLRNFFRNLPDELEDAAKIDGASDFTVYFRIVLPLSKPVLATIGLWLAVGLWNNWFAPYIYLTNSDLYTLPLILRKYIVESDASQIGAYASALAGQIEEPTPKQLIATVIIVAIAPIILVYPFIQRYFVHGLFLGSVKE